MNWQEIIKNILLGLVQGITEPLPISSSAHLYFVSYFFHVDLSLNEEVLFHFASLLAMLLFFWKRIHFHLKEKKERLSFLFKLIFASIPIGLIGVFLKDEIDDLFLEPFPVALALYLTGILLFISYLGYNKIKTRHEKLDFADTFLIGLFQAIGAIPGISRSGTSILAGSILDLDLKKTLEFSFYLFLIACFGSLVFSIKSFSFSSVQILEFLPGTIVCFITTYFSLKLFFQKIKPNLLPVFSFYCIILSSLLMIFIS